MNFFKKVTEIICAVRTGRSAHTTNVSLDTPGSCHSNQIHHSEESEQAGFTSIAGEDCRHEINKTILADCQDLYAPSRAEQGIAEKLDTDRKAGNLNRAMQLRLPPSMEVVLQSIR